MAGKQGVGPRDVTSTTLLRRLGHDNLLMSQVLYLEHENKNRGRVLERVRRGYTETALSVVPTGSKAL